jgi:AcrR family transcriptional regulator
MPRSTASPRTIARIASDHLPSPAGPRRGGRNGDPGQLPSGKHGLPRRYISANQRQRLLHGVALAIAESSYASVTVADITRAAKVSRRTFYEHFADKDECFAAAYEDALGRVLGELAAARTRHTEWPDQVRAAVEAFVDIVVADPPLGRLCLLEVTAVGGGALARRDATMEAFVASLLEGAPAHALGDAAVAQLTAELVVGGIAQVVNTRLMQGRVPSLRDDLSGMVYCALVPFCGHQVAGAKAREAAGGPAAVPA